jgi:hypothetical protein
MRQTIDDFLRAGASQSDMVTIKRLTGTRQGAALSVICQAIVQTGPEAVLIGSVQQTHDLLMVTDREMNAMQWPRPPRQGDQIVYSDGSTRTIQGRADERRLADGSVYIIKTLGG